MKLLRVNMSNLEITREDLPEEWRIVGGRGLSAEILNKEMPPEADPLGPEARLVITGGPLAGTLAPSCGRISVGVKSPLTLGIKEANCGGPFVQKLDRLGYRAVVVEGAPEDGRLYILNITGEGASLEDAERFKGKGNYDLAKSLRETASGKAAVLSIGIAGENKWKGATVGCTDMDGLPSRHAARGGVGAVMGAKGLKAILVDDSKVPAVELADKESFRDQMKAWAELMRSDLRIESMSRYGTTGGIVANRKMGTMPSKNYSSEETEGFEALSGPEFEKTNQARGGHMSGCMAGCLVRCSTVYHDAEGKHLTSALEYETLGLLGTNLGIADPDVVARLDRWCDDLGLDTIEVGSALGVAASTGKAAFGDAESFYALFEEIEKGTEFGATLANGVVSTCQALGVTRIPAFKGQAIPAHDPRASKATGVTYHTSPMGADHTAGVSYDDRLSKEGQVARSVGTQSFLATLDTLGYCILAIPGDVPKLMAFLKDLLNARYGLNLETKDLYPLGTNTLKTEVRFNKGTEFDKVHPYPEFLRTEPLAPDGSVFDVAPEEIAQAMDRFS